MSVRRRSDSNGWLIHIAAKHYNYRRTISGTLTKAQAMALEGQVRFKIMSGSTREEVDALFARDDAKVATEFRPRASGYKIINPPRVERAPNNWPMRLYSSTRASARARNIPFDLTQHDVARLCQRSKGRCEVTGIPFDYGVINGGRVRRAFAPSLDRLDNAKHYTMANCRVICLAMNIALADWGEAVFRALAESFVANDRRLSCGTGSALPHETKCEMEAQAIAISREKSADFSRTEDS